MTNSESPTPQAIRAARVAANLTQTAAGELLHTTCRVQGRQRMTRCAGWPTASRRAIRRCGELLKFFQTGPKAGRPKGNGDGTVPISQRSAGTVAGLSDRQIKTASRVANVPAEDFERQIESDNLPTVTKLAEQGKKHNVIDLGTTKPADFILATHALGQLRDFAELAGSHDPAQVVAGMKDYEKGEAGRNLAIIDAWLDQFSAALGV